MTLLFPISEPALSANAYAEFWQAVATEDEAQFLSASHAGLLTPCLPEWERMKGLYNTQHATHDFTLDVHTAKVLTKTRQSHYFQTLSPPWQELTTLAALLHDIDKEGGLAQDRFHLKPDMAHPAKAVATVRKRLPTWGFSQQAVEWASLLVAHHQAFGRWIMRAEFLKVEPTRQDAHHLADTLRSATLLQGLQALTEGDIRGVKEDDHLFTPFAEERLATYGAMVHEAIIPIELAHTHRLTHLLHHLGTTAQEAHASWLFPTTMKPEASPFLASALLPETMVATLPTSFLTDADASHCSTCSLKNQASGRVFPVRLQRLETMTADCFRVGILGNQLVGFEQQYQALTLQVSNPVALLPPRY